MGRHFPTFTGDARKCGTQEKTAFNNKNGPRPNARITGIRLAVFVKKKNTSLNVRWKGEKYGSKVFVLIGSVACRDLRRPDAGMVCSK
jgi:hypothetical protein